MQSNHPDQYQPKTEVMLKPFWGIKLLWGPPAILAPGLSFIAGGGAILSAFLFLVFGFVAYNTLIQKFGIKDGNLLYLGNSKGNLVSVPKSMPLSNVNQILLGQLRKAVHEATSLGWPSPEVVGGINVVKSFFVVLTEDRQTIAVPAGAFGKKDTLRFISQLQASGITCRTLDSL